MFYFWKKNDSLLWVVAVVVPEGLVVALEEAEASAVVEEGVAVTPEGSEVEAVSVEEAGTL